VPDPDQQSPGGSRACRRTGRDRQCVLGVDIGTSGSRAVLVGADGRVTDAEKSPHPSIRLRDGWVEQQPEDWWSSALAATSALLARHEGTAVAAVGLSGQTNGPVLLDARGQALGTCLIWADTRGAEECREIDLAVGAKTIAAAAGKPAIPAYTAPKLLWLRRHRPNAFRQAATFVLPKDYIRWRLTGSLGTDPSDASNTLLFDIGTRRWHDDIVRAIGLSPAILPDVTESAAVAGTVSPEAAGLTGLLAGTPVVTGAGDSMAAVAGNQLLKGGGDILVEIGSSGDVSAVVGSPAVDMTGRMHTSCHVTRDTWLLTGVQPTAGLAVEWFSRQLDFGDPVGSYARINDLALQADAGAGGVVFVPSLAGIRNPVYNDDARGAFFGLSLGTTPAQLTRAVIEGVCFAQRQSVDAIRSLGVPAERIVASGGGSVIALWRQALADITGLPVRRLPDIDTGAGSAALGAAILAGVSAGLYGSLSPAASTAWTTTAPDAGRTERYAALYEVFGALSDSLTGPSRLLAVYRAGEQPEPVTL
jgi:xylulokinase